MTTINQNPLLPPPLMSIVDRIAERHQLAIGVTEAALGSALLAYGLSNGLPELEKLYIRYIDPPNTWKIAVSGGGISLGSLAYLIGNIGITYMGTGIGVPAGLLALGGAVAVGSVGHLAGTWVDEFLLPDPDIWAIVLDAGFVVIGAGFLIDGLRRSWKEIAKIAKGEAEPMCATIGQNDEHRLVLGRYLMSEFYKEPYLVDEFRYTYGQFTPTRWAGRTFADLLATFKGEQYKYESTCRSALCHAVGGNMSHAFGALRIAASVNDNFARHHHIYGLIHAAEGRFDQARQELQQAKLNEPNEDTRQRIEFALSAL